MGVISFVGFGLKLLDLLAWPLLALGYPLYASVLAIETNSNADAQKLVTYWVLFSLISLVEHALGTLLVWLPFWPYMKLIFIVWLMIPHFDGAYYVYQHFVRPCLSMSSRVIIDGLNKKKELSLKGEDFLVEAEKYLNENGPEALEKLLSSQSMCKKPMVAHKYIVAAEVKEKKEVTALVASRNNEGTVSPNGITAVESKEFNDTITSKRKADKAGPNLTQTGIKFGSVENKQIPNAAKEVPISPPSESIQSSGQVPPEVSQREWTCALCQVTTNNESVLQSHLRGKKHKAALEALKVKKKQWSTTVPKQDGDKKSAPSNNGNKWNSSKKQGFGTGQAGAGLWCPICELRCSGTGNFVEHCNGKKHIARIQELTGTNTGLQEADSSKIGQEVEWTGGTQQQTSFVNSTGWEVRGTGGIQEQAPTGWEVGWMGGTQQQTSFAYPTGWE